MCDNVCIEVQEIVENISFEVVTTVENISIEVRDFSVYNILSPNAGNSATTDENGLLFVPESSGGVSVHNDLQGLNDGDYIHLTQLEKQKFDSIPDSFAPVATSNDYNDLDNLPTIPTKTSDLINDGEDGVNPFITANDLPTVPSFADQTETNAGTVSDKTIAPNTLAGWWIYVKGLAQTFSQKITFSLGALFSPQVAPTHERGRIYFDDVNDCISFMDSISGTSVQVGYETLMRARNNTGATIQNGAVVYISGAIGQNPTISLAQANTEPTSEIIGVATHSIANNTVGKVCVFGLVNDINTSAFTDGDFLYLSSSVAGGLTTTPPTSPNYVVSVGVVEHAHVTQGKILVKPQRALSNNNTLGTSQKVSVTENAVKSYVDMGLTLKQDTLVSGTNIKTINGTSILGSGNLIIESANDLYKNWFSYTASHVTSAIIYTQVANAILTANGTQSLVGAIGTTRLNSIAFLNYLSGTGAGALAGIKNQNNADGYIRNGYDAYFIFANNDTNANCQTIVGFTSLLPNFPNVDISAYTGDFQGVGNDVGDTNLSFYCKRVTATASYVKIPLGSGFPANDTSSAYLLRIEAPQTEVASEQFIKMTITNLITGATATHTFTSAECPALSQSISTIVCRSNRNTGVATNIRFGKVHITRKMY